MGIIKYADAVYRHRLSFASGGVQKKPDGQSYAMMLDAVRSRISDNHSNQFVNTILSPEESQSELKGLIQKYLLEYIRDTQIQLPVDTGVDDIVLDMYADMAEYGPLTDLLKNPDVEEINVNAWNHIYYTDSSGRHTAERTFTTPAEAVAIIRKMIRFGGKFIDETDPAADSDIGKGIRISALVHPAIAEDKAVIATIRRQKTAQVTLPQLIAGGTATQDMMDLLRLFLNNGISTGFAGATGSGKTASMGCLLRSVDRSKRIYAIEDSAELQLDQFDEQGSVVTDVVQTYASGIDGTHNMNTLLIEALRHSPDIIVPGEVRHTEACITMIKSGNTGHTICTSLHANSAREAYSRIQTLYSEGDTRLPPQLMLESIRRAIPIMVFLERLADGSRRIMEIFEATGTDERVGITGKLLYEYVIDREERNEKGEVVKIIGHHEKRNGISESIVRKLARHSVLKSAYEKYI